MAVNSFLSNQGTQSALLTDNTGGTAGTLIPVMKIATDAAGTFTTLWNGNVSITAGSVAVTAGTIASVGTIGTIGLATISGNLGTIGTVGLATVSGNLGTIGTVGLATVQMSSGTLNVATISTLPNLPQGSIQITAGTITTGTINLGTVTGKDANAAAQTSNPVAIGGTDSGGTVRTVLVDSTGAMKVSGASSGTFVNLSTGTLNAGTVTLSGGTLNLGTITGNIGTVSMLSAGTLTTIPNIPGGTIGSIIGIGSVSGLSNIPGGTINIKQIESVDTNNSTTGTLGAGGTYTGTFTDTLGYSAISLFLYSDQNSASRGVQMQFSSDGTSVYDSFNETFVAGGGTPNAGVSYVAETRARYYRFNYINGGTAQTAFVANSVLKTQPSNGDIILISSLPGSISSRAVLSKSAIMGKTTAGGGSWVDVKVNPSGALSVDPANGTVQISAGTINLGTFNMASGTLNVGTVVNNGGTVAVVQNAGTLQTGANTIGNIGTLITGTILSSGTTTGVGTVSNIGSLGMVNAGTINTGTFVMTVGTVNHGTIDNGTFRGDARTTQNIVTFGTQVSGTAAIAATIVGSASVGSGTSLWVNDLSVTNNNANVLVVVGFGTAQQGTNVLMRHNLGTSGAVGIEKAYPKAVNAGMTNQDLVVSLGAAGTIDFSVSYLISA